MTAPAYQLPDDGRSGFRVTTPPELMEEFRGMNSSQLEAVKEVFKHDLWFAARGVLGYDQLYEPLHGPLCNFLVHCDSTRRLILMSRGFLKSTVCTISNPIRLAVLDPTTYRACIENEIQEKAASFLDEIKNHWMFNEALRFLFPELVPIKFAGPGSDWSSTQASLNAARITRQSTWTCLGAGASGTSYHFNHIIPDDLVGEKQKGSPALMQATTNWNRNQDQLCDRPETDRIDWVGTRKLVDDTYADIMTREPRLVVFLAEPFTEEKVYCKNCKTEGHGASTFPTKFSTEWLCEKSIKDPEEWAHDYRNNPAGKGGMDWGESVLKDFWFSEDNARIMFICPFTLELKTWRITELDIVITCDPNKGDTTSPDKAAIIVHGTSPDGEHFALETYSGRPSPFEYVECIYEMAVNWNNRGRVREVGIEEAGQQNTAFWFKKHCLEVKKGGPYWEPVPLKHKNEEKPVRIRKSMDPIFKAKKFFTLRTQTTLRSQIKRHPQLAAHDWDELDCAAYGPHLYQKGTTLSKIEERLAAQKKVLDARGLTGYGNSFTRSQSHLRVVGDKEMNTYLKIFGKGGKRAS